MHHHFFRQRAPLLVSGVLATTIAFVAFRSAPAAVTIFTNTPGFLMEAIDFDSGGDLYYLETDFDAFTAPTNLVKRTAASGYADPTVIFTFGSFVFGSFVTVEGGRVYFGESSNGTIRSILTDGSDPVLHGTVPFNFDLEFSPAGSAFVSANAGGFGQGNEIALLDLNSGLTITVVTNTNDFSGPIAFDLDGNLYYGGTGGGGGAPDDVFRFTPLQIAGAISGSPLNLADGTVFVDTPGNSQFEFVITEGLVRHRFGGLTRIDPLTGSDTPIPGEPDAGLGFLGPIAHNGGALFGVSTNFGNNTSTFSLIPEPSSALLLLTGAVVALRLCRRRA